MHDSSFGQNASRVRKPGNDYRHACRSWLNVVAGNRRVVVRHAFKLRSRRPPPDIYDHGFRSMIQISQHPRATQNRQRCNHQQEWYCNQRRPAARIWHEWNGGDDRKDHREKRAAQILPPPTRFGRRNRRHNPTEEWTKGAGYQPERANAIGERTLHRHRRVKLRLVLNE